MDASDVDRQGFLGSGFALARRVARIGAVGVSGGGSHIVQQLAHLGFDRVTMFDADVFGKENLHRHVGARHADIAAQTKKVAIGQRVYDDVRPGAVVRPVDKRWQDRADLLRSYDLVIGCIDTFEGRKEIETTARRYLIPYIDIGMDVFTVQGAPPRVVGQMALSLPGGPCLECLSVVTERELAQEASRYGGKVIRQQVVNANGQLASAAIGVALDVLCGWSGDLKPPILLQYDGNRCTIERSRKLNGREHVRCPHFPACEVGDPIGIDL